MESLKGALSRARTPERKAELEAELALPVFPEELRYLWQAFLHMRRRKAGGWGVEPLSDSDLLAYSQVRQENLRPWEMAVIFDIDDLWLASVTADSEA